MQSEGFDKKIRDAADHHHPAYDEQSWTKMERLLNKYLPQKEDNRKIFFFLLLFILLGGGTWFFVSRSTNGQKKELAHVSQPVDKKIEPGVIKPGEKEITTGTQVITEENDNNTTIDPGKGNQSPDNKNNIIVADLLKNKNNSVTHFRNRQTQDINKKNAGITGADVVEPKDKSPVTDNKAPGTIKDPREVERDNLLVNKNTTDIPGLDKKDLTGSTNNNIKPAEPVKKESEPLAKTPDAKKNKPARKSKPSYLFFSASGGPDVSIVGSGSMGKMKWVGGVGIGYTYREKFTLRTGLYVARKIYTTTADDYHAPAAFYAYYPNLEKVAADCKVYEIPLSLSYNFGRTPKRNLFVSAGLSTYIMKRETYDFYYKYTTTGPTVSRERTIYNSNDHYFSVLSLSGGYQRKISKTFSIAAEPYLKLPITGIGFGKVKLNSGGVLFTIAARPFK